MSRRVVIAGGTGFIGRRLVRRLVADGRDVTVLTRDPGGAAIGMPARCRLVAWDPRQPLAPQVLRGMDAVVNLAGEGVADGRWSDARKARILASRVSSTRALVGALGALPAAERPRTFVSASAIGYYGDRDDTVLDETAAPGAGFLSDVCRAWENEATAAARLDVRTVILRIGIVLGREGGALARMILPFRLGLGGRLGSGRQWMSWIHRDDMVGLLAYALDGEHVTGVLNAVAPEPVTNRVFTARLARALRRPAFLPVPAFALRVALGEMASILLASQRVVPHAPERLGFAFAHPRLEGALADLCREHAHEVEYEQWIPRSPAEVFPFFADPRNLERITPPFLRFQVLGASTPAVREGTRIDYRLSLRGVPMRWQSRIERWEPERRFVDVQVRGPYRRWHHTHEFEPHAGGTLVRDRVRYELPLGALGELIAGRWVRRDVASIFTFRRTALAELFGTAAAPSRRAQ